MADEHHGDEADGQVRVYGKTKTEWEGIVSEARRNAAMAATVFNYTGTKTPQEFAAWYKHLCDGLEEIHREVKDFLKGR